MDRTEQSFKLAKEIYTENGVDVDAALAKLSKVALSIHAWQADDVTGFENTGHALTGGCQVTGNYPGRARTSDEVRQDLEFAMKYIPGKHRVCLQGHEVDRMFPGIDRDAFTIDNFSGWLEWSAAKRIPVDLAPAFYSHSKLDHGLSLSHPDRKIRQFWIRHGEAMRHIAAEFGKGSGTPSVCNFWMPDGFKDIPADRLTPRKRMAESLDEIFSEKISEKYVLDAVESKLFGIGTESCTITSHDFCLAYSATRGKLICLDMGHFHPTESVADKISSVRALGGRILLHVSRGVHWDSDHVVLLNDELLSLGRELAFCGLKDIHIGLDFFDATINRAGAWVIGARNMLKALLIGFLEPANGILAAEKCFDFTTRLAREEEAKTMPWQAVWNEWLRKNGTPAMEEFISDMKDYEKHVQFKRG